MNILGLFFSVSQHPTRGGWRWVQGAAVDAMYCSKEALGEEDENIDSSRTIRYTKNGALCGLLFFSR